MDPERVPPQSQSEVTSFHSLDRDRDTSGTIQPDPFNPPRTTQARTQAPINTNTLSTYTGNVPTESLSHEKSEVS